jgi:ketosteroid isomerase-like protein
MTGSTAKHPDIEVWEKVYETFTTGDMDRLAQLIAPDVVWHVPGDNLISGTYTTREAIFGCFNKIYELSEGTYQPRLLDILADDTYTVAILHGTARRGARRSTRITRSSRRSATGRSPSCGRHGRKVRPGTNSGLSTHLEQTSPTAKL